MLSVIPLSKYFFYHCREDIFESFHLLRSLWKTASLFEDIIPIVDMTNIRNDFVQPLFLTSTAPLSLSCAGTRIGEEHNTEINSRPPFKGNPIMRFCTNEKGRNGEIYYVVKNLRLEFVFFYKSKSTQEIQGQ